MFIFTNARATSFQPGPSAPHLRELLQSLKYQSNTEVLFSKENSFLFDNEAFRFLALCKNGIEFNLEEKKDYSRSWDYSIREFSRLICRIIQCDKHATRDTLSFNEAQQLNRKLVRPIGEIVTLIQENLQLAEQQKKMLYQIAVRHMCGASNEILYEIFEYLEHNDIYHGLFYLNNRFQNLLINLNIPFQIYLSTISKSHVDLYNKNVFQPNKHRINILRLSNPFTIELIFSPPCLLFIVKHLIHLPKLHTLIPSPIDYILNSTIIFTQVFCLKKLKYCKLTYRVKDNKNVLPIDFDQYEQSSIEYLIINSPFRYESFQKLFIYLSKLRHLSINFLLGSNHPQIDFYPIELKDLNYVFFDLHSIHFHQFEELIKHFFHHIKVLRISTFNDSSYSHAKQWEELTSSSMPNLHIFDMNNSYTTAMHRFLYLCLSGQFRSKL
ncbi:unnamed protein product [Rotaria sp. Silwood1]|nr:unnamed protein product [Rotaria sp. Silwood1]